jgi:DNA-binding MarR family transcriptional regulator
MYMTEDMKADRRRPIGYWLKHLDRLIEDTFSRTLAGHGLTRRHWQVLNTLAHGPASPADLTKALDPFLRDDPTGQATTEADLIDRGWVSHDHNGRLCLTPHGQTAHQQTHEQVQQTRGLMLHGVDAGEYAAVIDILTRMAANLENNAA